MNHNFNRLLYICLAILLFGSLTTETTTAQSERPSIDIITNGQSVKHFPRVNLKDGDCEQMPYRSTDGTCNNTTAEERFDWGATDIPLRRNLPAAYGTSDPLNALGGEQRPSARAVSNLLCNQTESIPNELGLSSWVYTWGQFLDHDIDLSPEGEEYAGIPLPGDETLFQAEIPFHRSLAIEGTGETNTREQSNIISSWIDASNVYGSNDVWAAWLRTFDQGKLKTSAGDLLPYNTLDAQFESEIDPNAPFMAGDDGGTVKVFVAGDLRANEQPGLTVLHTLFVREHNRICDELAMQGFQSDEVMYQVARKRVGAIIQKITFDEFLPALGVSLSQYDGYNPDLQADISNLFAHAAYRLGHTMVASEILLRREDCSEVGEGSISLFEGFFNPTYLQTLGLEPLVLGFAKQFQEEVDTKIVDDLRNLLFPNFESDVVFGLDLAALNIQRGRDHGIPDYNSIRQLYTGVSASAFSDITSNPEVIELLAQAYSSVNDIDPWVGLLAEDRLPGRAVGQTLHQILARQFQELRDGDFYFYKNDPYITPFEVNQIEQTALSDILLRNTDIELIQADVFFADVCEVVVIEDGEDEEMGEEIPGDDTDGQGNGDDNAPNGNNDGPGGNNNGGNQGGDENNGGPNGNNNGPGGNDGGGNNGGPGGNNGNPGGNGGPGGNNGGPGGPGGPGGANGGNGGNGPGGPGGRRDTLDPDVSDNPQSKNLRSEKHLDQNAIEIYPNPTSDIARVKLFEGMMTGKISIYDLNGKKIKEDVLNQSLEYTMDVSSWRPGTYVIRWNGDENVSALLLVTPN